jgi:hypothetical protein
LDIYCRSPRGLLESPGQNVACILSPLTSVISIVITSLLSSSRFMFFIHVLPFYFINASFVPLSIHRSLFFLLIYRAFSSPNLRDFLIPLRLVFSLRFTLIVVLITIVASVYLVNLTGTHNRDFLIPLSFCLPCKSNRL